jgi:hypothetical protein
MSVAAREACPAEEAVRGIAKLAIRSPSCVYFLQRDAIVDRDVVVGGHARLRVSRDGGQRPADFEMTLKFGLALNRLTAEDPAVHKLTLEVQHLLKPRSVYRDPDLVPKMAEA